MMYSCMIHTTEGDIFLLEKSVPEIYRKLSGIETIYTVVKCSDVKEVKRW